VNIALDKYLRIARRSVDLPYFTFLQNACYATFCNILLIAFVNEIILLSSNLIYCCSIAHKSTANFAYNSKYL